MGINAQQLTLPSAQLTIIVDGDGEITVSELETAARRIYDKDVSPAHIAEIFKAVDANSDGTIDFEEFLQMMSTIGEDGDGKALVDAFREFDVNGDGFISLAELKLVLSRFGALFWTLYVDFFLLTEFKGQRQTDEELAEILRVADKNGDGSIDYEGESWSICL